MSSLCPSIHPLLRMFLGIVVAAVHLCPHLSIPPSISQLRCPSLVPSVQSLLSPSSISVHKKTFIHKQTASSSIHMPKSPHSPMKYLRQTVPVCWFIYRWTHPTMRPLCIKTSICFAVPAHVLIHLFGPTGNGIALSTQTYFKTMYTCSAVLSIGLLTASPTLLI